MRRAFSICISILIAVLSIGTAFADFRPLPAKAAEPQAAFLSDLRNRIIPEFEDTGLNMCRYRNYPQVSALSDQLNTLAERIEKNGMSMQTDILRYAEERHPFANDRNVIFDLGLDWKLLGTLLFTYHEHMTDALRQNLNCVFSTDPEGRCTAAVGFSDFDDLLWLDREEDWFAARNTYYYLNTVYDDNGELRRSTGYFMPIEKLDALAFPLDAKWYTRIKTTWFRSRDGGIRKHTGMDIRCSHGSPIYACSGGVVNSVGYHVKGGYYVSVQDDDGFEYFYYHMKKDSQCVVRGQRVEKGEQIGLSGNTGNSAAPHLHLSIVTPERRFVDPFNIYYRWVYRKTGMLVKRPR